MLYTPSEPVNATTKIHRVCVNFNPSQAVDLCGLRLRTGPNASSRGGGVGTCNAPPGTAETLASVFPSAPVYLSAHVHVSRPDSVTVTGSHRRIRIRRIRVCIRIRLDIEIRIPTDRLPSPSDV